MRCVCVICSIDKGAEILRIRTEELLAIDNGQTKASAHNKEGTKEGDRETGGERETTTLKTVESCKENKQ